MIVSRYSISVEPLDGVSFIHADVLGTEEEARKVAANIFQVAYNQPGKMAARTVAVLHDAYSPRKRRIVDVFDGQWSSEAGWDD